MSHAAALPWAHRPPTPNPVVIQGFSPRIIAALEKHFYGRRQFRAPRWTRNTHGPLILFALAFRITVLVANAMLNALTTAADAGTAAVIQGYTASQPATPETAIGAQTLLFTLTMSASSFGAAASHVITAATITDDSSADNTGTLAWFRLLTQSGGTAICDGSAGTSSADMIANTTAITSGSTVSCSSATIDMPVA